LPALTEARHGDVAGLRERARAAIKAASGLPDAQP
jgi:hypothetical protein